MTTRRIVTLANPEHSSAPARVEAYYQRLRQERVRTIDIATRCDAEECFDNTIEQLEPGDLLVAIGGDNTANRAIRAAREFGNDTAVAAVSAGGACDTAAAWNGPLATDIIGVLRADTYRTVYPCEAYLDGREPSYTFFSSLSLGWTAIVALRLIDSVRDIRKRRTVSDSELVLRATREYFQLQQQGKELPEITTLYDVVLPYDMRVAKESIHDGLTDVFIANNSIIGGAFHIESPAPYLDPEALHLYMGNLATTSRAVEFSLRSTSTGMPGKRVERLSLECASPITDAQIDGDSISPQRAIEITKGKPVVAVHPRIAEQARG